MSKDLNFQPVTDAPALLFMDGFIIFIDVFNNFIKKKLILTSN